MGIFRRIYTVDILMKVNRILHGCTSVKVKQKLQNNNNNSSTCGLGERREIVAFGNCMGGNDDGDQGVRNINNVELLGLLLSYTVCFTWYINLVVAVSENNVCFQCTTPINAQHPSMHTP